MSLKEAIVSIASYFRAISAIHRDEPTAAESRAAKISDKFGFNLHTPMQVNTESLYLKKMQAANGSNSGSCEW